MNFEEKQALQEEKRKKFPTFFRDSRGDIDLTMVIITIFGVGSIIAFGIIGVSALLSH